MPSRTPTSKKVQHHECFLRNEGEVDEQVCVQLSSSPHNNKICVKMECASPWRRCSACATHGTVEEHSRVVDRESGLCTFHIDNGEQQKKPTGEGVVVPIARAHSVPKGSVKDAHTPASLNAVLQEVMKTASEPTDVPVKAIRRFAEQPRETFGEKDLQELGESLKIVQIVPVFLRKLSADETKEDPAVLYELVDGERRWRACVKVGKKTIRAIFLEIADKRVQFAISAIANFGRKEHTPREEALAIQYMRTQLRMPPPDVAKAFSKSVPWVYQRLALLDLHDEIQRMLDSNLPRGRRIKTSVASFLAGYRDKEFQLECAREIMRKGMSHASAIAFIRQKAAQKNIATARRHDGNTPKRLLDKTLHFVGISITRCDELAALPKDQIMKMFPDLVARRVMHAKLLELVKKVSRLVELTKI